MANAFSFTPVESIKVPCPVSSNTPKVNLLLASLPAIILTLPFSSLHCCVSPTISIPPVLDLIWNLLVEITPALILPTSKLSIIALFIMPSSITTFFPVRWIVCVISAVMFPASKLFINAVLLSKTPILALDAFKSVISAFVAANLFTSSLNTFKSFIVAEVASNVPTLALTAFRLLISALSITMCFTTSLIALSEIVPSSLVILSTVSYTSFASFWISSKDAIVFDNSHSFLSGSSGYSIIFTILCLSLNLSFLEIKVIISPKLKSKMLYSFLFIFAKSWISHL